MCVLFIPIVWFTFQYNFMHYAQFFQQLYWVLTQSVSLCPTLPYIAYIVNFEHIQCNVSLHCSIRQVRVATTQINSTIKHISFYHVSHQSHSKSVVTTTQNLSPSVTTHNSIYHPHKTFYFSDKGILSFSVWKPQMKLELKDSRDINWENFELRKSWLDYSIIVNFFV